MRHKICSPKIKTPLIAGFCVEFDRLNFRGLIQIQ